MSPKKGISVKSKSKPVLPTSGKNNNQKKISYQYDELNGSLEMAHELNTYKEISASDLSPCSPSKPKLSKHRVQLYQSPYKKKLEQGMRIESEDDLKESKSNCIIY